jgi:hypothetical protein
MRQATSAFGTKRTCCDYARMSAYRSKQDIMRSGESFCFRPISDMRSTEQRVAIPIV